MATEFGGAAIANTAPSPARREVELNLARVQLIQLEDGADSKASVQTKRDTNPRLHCFSYQASAKQHWCRSARLRQEELMPNLRDARATFATIAGGLRSTTSDRASLDALAEARAAIAQALAAGQIEPIDQALTADRIAIGAELTEHLSETALAEAEQALQAQAAADLPGQESARLVFARRQPFFTSQISESVPAWAAGMRRGASLGPFIDELGRPTWIDIIDRLRATTTITRAPGGAPMLVAPVRGLVVAGTRYRLASGSLWMASRLLAAGAPTGGYSGIRISGGTLEVNAPTTMAGDGLQVSAGATVTLEVQLEPAAAATPTHGPGIDAGEASVALPAVVRFVCSPTGIRVDAAGAAALKAFGTNVPMEYAASPPTYSALLNRILVPFASAAAAYAVAECRSALFRLTGTAPITGAAWALPVAIVEPSRLGEASGSGAMALTLGAGLSAEWITLEAGPTRLGAANLMVEPGRIALTAATAVSLRAAHHLSLWTGARGRPASMEVDYAPTFPLHIFSEQTGTEAVVVQASVRGNLDLPVQADGGRIPVRHAQALVGFIQQPSGFKIIVSAQAAVDPSARPTALALHNALFTVWPTDSLWLSGDLEPPGRVPSAALARVFAIASVTPMLPDPYAANIAPFKGRGRRAPTGALTAVVQWPEPTRAELTFRLSGGRFVDIEPLTDPGAASNPSSVFGPTIVDTQSKAIRRFEEDRERLAHLERLFNEAAGAREDALVMLDVSSNADQFGIGFNISFDRRAVATPSAASQVQVRGLDLVSFGRNVRVLTAPAISWEPVVTAKSADPTDPLNFFPSVLASANDGGPTRLGVNSVELVPIAPLPAIDHLLAAFHSVTDPRPMAAMLTLPFGIRAVAHMRRASDHSGGPNVTELRPDFAQEDVRGGRQLQLSAGLAPADPGAESPGFEGAAIQMRNGTTLGGFPLFTSVLGTGDPVPPPPGSLPPGDSPVAFIFNEEFGPNAAPAGGTRPRVPLTRYDVSGYGASALSDWLNPKAAYAATSEVRFDVFVGRTAYEVVQVRSYLYPWAVPVVRTITMQRRSGGGVIRKDSGWQAAGPGLFLFPAPAATWGGSTADRVRPDYIHPGAVRGVFNVRNVRDLPRGFAAPSGEGQLTAVTFDADVLLEGVVRGGSGGFVPSRGQVGFVQIAPTGAPLTRVDFRDLLEHEGGTLGGPVECALDVGGSGLLHRVVRAEVGHGVDAAGQPVFAAVARGAPVLPQAGAWSVARLDLGSGEVTPASSTGVPLVREGDARPGAVKADRYRFADPMDVVREDSPSADYGFLHAMDTQRVLYRRPKVKVGDARVTSTQRPLLADPWSMLRAAGVFPKAADCLEVPTNNFELAVYAGSEGELKLNLPFLDGTFALDATLTRTLTEVAQTRSFAQYANKAGEATRVTLAFDSRAAEPWRFTMAPVSVVVSSGSTEAFRFHLPLTSSASTATRFDNPEMVLGPPFDIVKSVLEVLKALGVAPALQLGMSNEWKISGGAEVELPEIEFGAAKLIEVGAATEVSYSLSSPSSSLVSYEVSAGLVFATAIPGLYAGGLLKLEVAADPVLVTSITTMAVVVFGGDLLGGEAEVQAGVGVEFGFGEGVFNLYGLIMVKAEIKWFKDGPFKNFIGAAFTFELKGGYVQRTCPAGETWYTAGEVSVALEVSVCWVLTISIEYSEEFYAANGPELCPFEP